MFDIETIKDSISDAVSDIAFDYSTDCSWADLTVLIFMDVLK